MNFRDPARKRCEQYRVAEILGRRIQAPGYFLHCGTLCGQLRGRLIERALRVIDSLLCAGALGEDRFLAFQGLLREGNPRPQCL